MQSKFLAHSDLEAWLGELSSDCSLIVPQLEGDAKPGVKSSPNVVYRPYFPGCAAEFERKAAESAKHVLFPRSEGLFAWKNLKGEHGAENLQLREPDASEKTVVFGLLSCDARGFMVFDPVYDGSGSEGRSKDPYYLRRRANTVLIVKSCDKILNTCFCHWVGGGPASDEGADVLAFKQAEGWLLRPVTGEGLAVLQSALLKDASETQEKAADEAGSAAMGRLSKLSPPPEMEKAPPALRDIMENKEFWQAESSHCLACLACTNLCPTCYCFNINDETGSGGGVRLRNWDSCMSSLFTLEASGHNPRNGKAQRLRNRVEHKFSYYPGLHGGRMACCGCGRCIKSCPSGVDIRAIVKRGIAKSGQEGANE